MSGDIFGCHTRRVLLASRGERLGMLLYVQIAQGVLSSPPMKNYLGQMSVVPRLRNLLIGQFKYFKLAHWIISMKEDKSPGWSLMGIKN